MTEKIILALTPIFGILMAVGVVFWQSWRDGVLPNQKPRPEAAPDKKK